MSSGDHSATVAAHADWSGDTRKRWIAVARQDAGVWRLAAPVPVGEVGTLLARLRDAALGGAVALGLDLPIGLPRGYAIHLGSTGCTPNETKITVPMKCSEPNRPEIELAGFDPARDVVIADLAALLKDSNVDSNQEHTAVGCMSAPDDSDCAPLFANFGLPFAGRPAGNQSFFHRQESPSVLARAER